MALFHVSHPPWLRLVGVRTSYIHFSNISWTPWVLDPITNPFLGPSSWLHPASGGVGNGAAEEDWCCDLNPGTAALRGLFGTMWLGQRRTMDFYFFFWDTLPQTGQRGKEGLCICGYSKGLWYLNEDIKVLLFSLYNSINKWSLSFSPISGIERRLPWQWARRTCYGVRDPRSTRVRPFGNSISFPPALGLFCNTKTKWTHETKRRPTSVFYCYQVYDAHNL